MSALIVIPARYASSRYPGKPLVGLTGATGETRSLIERTWRAAQGIAGVGRIVIATDDDRIRDAASAFGAEVVMTPETCANGTERCAAAHAALGYGHEVVVNLQGDAPLTPPWFLEALIEAMQADPTVEMSTPVLRCNGATLDSLREDRRAGRVGGTTAVFDGKRHALYFSKEVIPFTAADFPADAPTPVFHHVGAYAYRAGALMDYAGWPEGTLERLEGLEQLRFLEAGARVLCVEVESRGRPFWELNNPEDVPRIEAMMRMLHLP
ncbi:MAG: manno-octulosonate cytidylyltransferase [Pseudomonadota bacterium]